MRFFLNTCLNWIMPRTSFYLAPRAVKAKSSLRCCDKESTQKQSLQAMSIVDGVRFFNKIFIYWKIIFVPSK